jgi:hypothetical protein
MEMEISPTISPFLFWGMEAFRLLRHWWFELSGSVIFTHRSWVILTRARGSSEIMCTRCGKKIEIGSRIHHNSKNTSFFQGKCKVWHIQCYEEMFIEC